MKTIDESLRVPLIIGVFDRNRAIAVSLLEKATPPFLTSGNSGFTSAIASSHFRW